MKEILVAQSAQLNSGEYRIMKRLSESVNGRVAMSIVYNGRLDSLADGFMSLGIYGTIVEKSNSEYYVVLSEEDFERFTRRIEERE
jgi:intein/homing endonuclease